MGYDKTTQNATSVSSTEWRKDGHIPETPQAVTTVKQEVVESVRLVYTHLGHCAILLFKTQMGSSVYAQICAILLFKTQMGSSVYSRSCVIQLFKKCAILFFKTQLPIPSATVPPCSSGLGYSVYSRTYAILRLKTQVRFAPPTSATAPSYTLRPNWSTGSPVYYRNHNRVKSDPRHDTFARESKTVELPSDGRMPSYALPGTMSRGGARIWLICVSNRYRTGEDDAYGKTNSIPANKAQRAPCV
ncbi:hypothetical protein B0T16DRAFT_394881 [Cercophora newfieldiana]|uniref:Uncharacterized protein n=1 Tax=Cercophora newfieldiana TaxID=92897 RepID=A0AA39XU08_9PEZI|nr:hypothetical protein B0T16DRAFT_394881 [Cercophora newfieldiana]